MRVLVIADGEDMMNRVSFCLRLRWPDVIILFAAEGSKGIEMVEAEAPDLVVADFSLPDMKALKLVARVREFSDVPLIMLVDEVTEMERAELLEAGADELATKPLSPIDFLAQVNALLRRAHAVCFQRNHMPLVSGVLTISRSTHEVFLSGEPVKLTPHEYDLLLQLVRNEGRVVTHRSLLQKVWGPEYTGDLGFLKKYIYRLRQKLHDDADKPRTILTERGVGYKFARRE